MAMEKSILHSTALSRKVHGEKTLSNVEKKCNTCTREKGGIVKLPVKGGE